MLPNIAYALNNTPKEVIGFHKPLTVYFGRTKTMKSADKIRRQASSANTKCNTKWGSLNRRKCSVYYRNEKVLLNYSFRKSRIPRKRAVIDGKIIQRGTSLTRYFVSFQDPVTKSVDKKWVSVERITSLTREKEISRQKCTQKYLQQLTKRRFPHKRSFTPTNVDGSDSPRRENKKKKGRAFLKNATITLNPNRYGNCQFDAVAHQLTKVGVHCTGEQLRKRAIAHLQQHNDFYSEVIGNTSFEIYIKRMKSLYTYGDHLTLCAMAREYNVQCLVLSSLGNGHHRIISNTGRYEETMPLITIGHYPEAHYVSIEVANSSLIKYLRDVSTSHVHPEEPIESEDRYAEDGSYKDGDTIQQLPLKHLRSRLHLKHLRSRLKIIQNRSCLKKRHPRSCQRKRIPNSNPLGRTSGLQSKRTSGPSTIQHKFTKMSTDCYSDISHREYGIKGQEDAPAHLRNHPNMKLPYSRLKSMRFYSNPKKRSFRQPSIKQLRSHPKMKKSGGDMFNQLSQTRSQQQDQRSISPCDYEFLPREIQVIIIQHTLRIDPNSRFTLQNVNRFFRQIVHGYPLPSLHINYSVLQVVPIPISVRRLIRAAGRYSWLGLEVRRIINRPSWFNAWLFLIEIDNRMFELRNIWYRRRQ